MTRMIRRYIIWSAVLTCLAGSGCGAVDGVALIRIHMQELTDGKLTDLRKLADISHLNMEIFAVKEEKSRGSMSVGSSEAYKWNNNGITSFSYVSTREEDVIATITPIWRFGKNEYPLNPGKTKTFRMRNGEVHVEEVSFKLEKKQ